MNLHSFLKTLPASLLLFSLLIASCDPDEAKPAVCDTDNVSFTTVILPIIDQSCRSGCHNGDNPSSGFSLETYDDVKAKVNQGRLAGAVAQEAGFSAMPLSMDPLDSCEVNQIIAWIDQGALDN